MIRSCNFLISHGKYSRVIFHCDRSLNTCYTSSRSHIKRKKHKLVLLLCLSFKKLKTLKVTFFTFCHLCTTQNLPQVRHRLHTPALLSGPESPQYLCLLPQPERLHEDITNRSRVFRTYSQHRFNKERICRVFLNIYYFTNKGLCFLSFGVEARRTRFMEADVFYFWDLSLCRKW